MTMLKRFIQGFVFFFAAIMLFSCNLEDFNLKKLTNKEDIVPVVFAPLAYGTFKVSDLVTTTIADGFPIPAGGMPLDSILLSKTGTSFRSAAIDTVYLITHVNNGTPVDMDYELSFFDNSTNLTTKYQSGPIPHDSIDFKVIFPLKPQDQDNLQSASEIKLNFKLLPPTTGSITYGAIKSKWFTVKISFYAPVNLRKL